MRSANILEVIRRKLRRKKSSMNIVVEQNEPARHAGELLSEALVKARGKPTLLMLSGGSSLGMLEYVPREVLGPHMTMTMLDERHGTDAASSNFVQMTQTNFYVRAKEAGAQIISTRPKEGEGLEEAAQRFKSSVEDWLETYKDGFVIATIGIGSEGHTAGIFPFPEDPDRFNMVLEKGLIVEYSVSAEKSKYQHRLTVTLPFLRTKVDTAIGYVVGENKRKAFLATVADEGTLLETPSRILHEMKDVTLVTDIVE